jgi:hypothetical protein
MQSSILQIHPPTNKQTKVFAEKYDIEVLQIAYEAYLISTLSFRNSVQLLRLAIQTNAVLLKGASISNIGSTWDEFRDDTSLKALLDANPKVSHDILFAIPESNT